MTKVLLRMVVAGLVMASFTGCSTLGKKSNGEEASVVTPGVEASGIGSEDGFGGDTNASARQGSSLRVENQTYYFAFDKSEVSNADMPSIEVQAKYLASHPEARIVLQGHTDPRGSREYNIGLGERRAKSIATILMADGVTKDQIKVVSYGAEKLASLGHSEDDYQLDRRVHLVYEAK